VTAGRQRNRPNRELEQEKCRTGQDPPSVPTAQRPESGLGVPAGLD